MSCSPKYNSNKQDGVKTCYNLKDLKEIAKEHNKNIKNKENKIKLNQKKENLYNSIKELNFEKCGDNEFCWLKQNSLEINKDANKFLKKFRPKQPESWKKNKNKWLNTYNLLNVMMQYQEKYKKFHFLGVHPIDFEFKINSSTCVAQEMCDLDLKELKKNNKNKLGAIFNLDKHTQSGSHWVSLFINLDEKSNNYGIYYYDSNGIRAPYEVQNFVLKIQNQNKELMNQNKELMNQNKKNDKNLKFYQNNIKHQNESSECGMFSLYFIDQSLKNISFDLFVNKKNLNDKYVFDLRDKYFNKINSV